MSAPAAGAGILIATVTDPFNPDWSLPCLPM